MIRKLFLILLTGVLIISTVQTVCATDVVSHQIILNDKPLVSDAVEQEGYFYLPVRAVSESLGFEVSWSQADQTAKLTSKDKVISLNLKEFKIKVNDHEYYMVDTPIMIKDRIFMKGDFFLDNLDLTLQELPNKRLLMNSVKENKITIKTMKVSSETKALITEIKYPVIGGLGDTFIQNQLNAKIKKLADQAAMEGVKNAADLAPFIIENPDLPGQCGTYFDYQIKYNQNDMISVVFENYQYAGGAHGNMIKTAYTINLKTGHQYALKEFFKDNADYVSIISNRVKMLLNERNLTTALLEPFDRISETQNYYVSNNGVVVFFQQYEYLPYAAGSQEFTINYSLLSNLLKEPAMFNGVIVRDEVQ